MNMHINTQFCQSKTQLKLSSTDVNFESPAAVEPRQRISNIYIYLYVSDPSVFIVPEEKGIILPAKSRSDVMFCLQSYGTYLS